jgi:hypothetical protein
MNALIGKIQKLIDLIDLIQHNKLYLSFAFREEV